MTQVRYLNEDEGGRAQMRVYVNRSRNTHELGYEEAHRIAERIAARGRFAQVMFGGNVERSYGLDFRAR